MGEDKFNEQIYKKYTALKKRKLLDDELAREREADVKKFREAMMDWVKELEGKNEELRQKMSDMIDAHESNCENFLKEIHERDKEILRLSLLLAEKTDPNNSTAAQSLNRATETLNPSPVPLAKGTSKSHSKEKKRLQFSEEANVPCSSSPVDQRSQEVECSRSHMCANMIHMRQLLESLVSMKISLNKEAEGFSFSAWHENTGTCLCEISYSSYSSPVPQ